MLALGYFASVSCSFECTRHILVIADILFATPYIVILVAKRALSEDSFDAPASASQPSADSGSAGAGAGTGGYRRAPQGYVVEDYYWY